jgi:hypothetical protein
LRRVSGKENSGLKEQGNDRFESSEGRRWEGILRDINKCGGVFEGNDSWLMMFSHLRMVNVPHECQWRDCWHLRERGMRKEEREKEEQVLEGSSVGEIEL